MRWLVEDMRAQLRAWGHAGGAGGELIVKSAAEPAMLAVRNAVMKYHGGRVVLEQPVKGETPQNGLAEEAGKTIRVYV